MPTIAVKLFDDFKPFEKEEAFLCEAEDVAGLLRHLEERWNAAGTWTGALDFEQVVVFKNNVNTEITGQGDTVLHDEDVVFIFPRKMHAGS